MLKCRCVKRSERKPQGKNLQQTHKSAPPLPAPFVTPPLLAFLQGNAKLGASRKTVSGLCSLPSTRCVLIRQLPSKLIRSVAGSSETSKQAGSWQPYSSGLALAALGLPEFLKHQERQNVVKNKHLNTTPAVSILPATASFFPVASK